MGTLIGCLSGRGDSGQSLLRELTRLGLGKPNYRCESASGNGIAILHDRYESEVDGLGGLSLVSNGLCAIDGHIWILERNGERKFVNVSEFHRLVSTHRSGVLSSIGGEFAAVSWTDDSNRLLLLGDPLGVKRIFWARLPGGGLLFSNNTSAIVKHPEVSKTPNSESIALSLCGLEISPEATHFKDVHALAPGQYLSSQEGQVHIGYYFEIPVVDDDDRSFEEICRDYRDRFTRSVSLQSGLSVRPGVALSGGLDSSSILRVLAKSVKEPSVLVAVTANVPGDRDSDESLYARQAVEGTRARGGIR